MKEWEMIAAIEQMDAHHFTIFAGGVHPDYCHGCGQKWPCRNQQLKRRIVAEIRRLKKLESDHV